MPRTRGGLIDLVVRLAISLVLRIDQSGARNLILAVVISPASNLVRFIGINIFVVGFLELDEGVDNILLIAFCPAKRPVTGFGDPGHHDEDDEDANLHAK
ncbi:hypothetical protein HG531_011925 [Fusarium graminearum]|nr:hypothetical protein HG531_011925 [Fusarium graminearum]